MDHIFTKTPISIIENINNSNIEKMKISNNERLCKNQNSILSKIKKLQSKDQNVNDFMNKKG